MPDSMVMRAEKALLDELNQQAMDGRCSVEGEAVTLATSDLVRAVLLSLREPSEAMNQAGQMARDMTHPDPSLRGNEWLAMISAALAEYE